MLPLYDEKLRPREWSPPWHTTSALVGWPLSQSVPTVLDSLSTGVIIPMFLLLMETPSSGAGGEGFASPPQ